VCVNLFFDISKHLLLICAFHSSHFLPLPPSISLPPLPPVYVIGGIVDRTVVRGVSQEAASRWNIKTARLPLEYLNNLKEKQATAALNVDTMVKAMMSVHANGGDWLAAFEECLPRRKASEKSKGEVKRERREREARGEEEKEEEEEEEEVEGNVS